MSATRAEQALGPQRPGDRRARPRKQLMRGRLHLLARRDPEAPIAWSQAVQFSHWPYRGDPWHCVASGASWTSGAIQRRLKRGERCVYFEARGRAYRLELAG